jgi:hypothetical protein
MEIKGIEVLTVATVVASNEDEAMVALVMGDLQSLARVWSQAVGFVLMRLAGFRFQSP